MAILEVKIKRISEDYSNNPLPEYKTSGSAGMDILASINSDIIIKAGQIELVPTNLAIELPSGFECQVRSRSGLAIKNGIFCLNSPGTIDSDYRGEIKVILANFGKEDFVIKNGDRIAQLVIAKYEYVQWTLVEELSDSNRGEGGFGSTGVN
jgi:dUTP pyrophosphatase